MAETTVTPDKFAVRVRIEHSRTQRDGWGYSTTVEVTSDSLDDFTDMMPDLLTDTRLMAENERDIRNRRDAARNEVQS
ncbi:MAG: hypothetical protein AB7R89_13880 [Dehalococcoidia bacterium]